MAISAWFEPCGLQAAVHRARQSPIVPGVGPGTNPKLWVGKEPSLAAAWKAGGQAAGLAERLELCTEAKTQKKIPASTRHKPAAPSPGALGTGAMKPAHKLNGSPLTAALKLWVGYSLLNQGWDKPWCFS